METHKKINIAIDGYSSCGKSTIAKGLARKLGYTYIDSGAMYRAVTLYLLEERINPCDTEQVNAALQHIHIKLESRADLPQSTVYLNGKDVSTRIRDLEIANRVSEVAAIKEVRVFAVALQQSMGREGGVVMDGRDIGTVVFPDAQLKIFMTASEEVRVQRRYLELSAGQPDITLEEVRANIRHRDHIDTTREQDPLTRAPDALVLDNSHMTRDEQLELVMQWYDKVVGG